MDARDFELSDPELIKINAFINSLSRQFRESERESIDDVTITFNFSIPLGRTIYISVSGSTPVNLEDIIDRL